VPQDRPAPTFRTDPAVMAELDRWARNTGLSRNDVLNLIVRAGVEAGIETAFALAASGTKENGR
jgi:hypothetical protein